MGLTSTDDSVSIFKDGKLRPGVYKIQNIVGQTYVDIREHARELCCRPATVLEGKGLVGSGPPYNSHRRSYDHFSGKSSLLVPVIPSAGCGVTLLSFRRIGLNREERSSNQANLINSASCSLGWETKTSSPSLPSLWLGGWR